MAETVFFGWLMFGLGMWVHRVASGNPLTFGAGMSRLLVSLLVGPFLAIILLYGASRRGR